MIVYDITILLQTKWMQAHRRIAPIHLWDVSSEKDLTPYV
jgi:hypothetical protein